MAASGYWQDMTMGEARVRIVALERALVRQMQLENGCMGNRGHWLDRTTRPIDGPPCGASGEFDAEKCGCAGEARNAVAAAAAAITTEKA
jgi:hypothetical protein